jgi:hypothetical protein
MSDFLEKLHWRMPMQSTPAARWTSWARSLSAGRRRIYSRRHAAVMRLLRPAIPIHRSSHLWQLKARSLFPRINLVVGPILQLFAKRPASLAGSQAPRSAGASELRRDFLSGVKTTAQRLWESGKVKAAESDELRAAQGMRRGPEQNRDVVQSDYSGPVPLRRVFRRLTTAPVQNENRKLMSKESVTLTRRVVEETRRIERYRQISMVTKQDQVARNLVASARAAETKILDQLSELDKTGPNLMTGGGPVAGLSVDQLTEQIMRKIDQQIVAHKERMGKVF